MAVYTECSSVYSECSSVYTECTSVYTECTSVYAEEKKDLSKEFMKILSLATFVNV